MGNKKIIFDLVELQEFIDDLDVTHSGRCGDHYYEQFRLSNDGILENIYYSYSYKLADRFNKDWQPTDLKGKVVDKHLWIAEHVRIDDYWIFGIFSTEEKAWRECIKHFMERKSYRLIRKIYNKEFPEHKWPYNSVYKRYQVREIKIDEAYEIK